MTPEQKANNLCMRFLIQTTTDIPYGLNKTIAKECALITVDEIIESDWFIPTLRDKHEWTSYWKEVKTEIEKL